MSTGTIIKMVHQCAVNTEPVMDTVRADISASPLAHFDEIGVQATGRLCWVHVTSTNTATYLYLSDKRGKKGIDEDSVLPNFHGTAIHDCWVPYIGSTIVNTGFATPICFEN